MDTTIATTAEAHESDALPRRVDVHTEAAEPRPNDTLPQAVTQKPLKDKSPAEWAYERLILYIQNFEETLDEEHELAMAFAGSDAGVLRIEGLGFFDPDMVTFYGSGDDSQRTQLIQHVSQLNVILKAVPIQRAEEAPRRIGFRLASKLQVDPA
ncbi:DUF6173 family protein [Tropicibacter naphthalenivorans]|uniref:Uncharacterized protein n=1 Tax=Tropicibacter naphthalenivorans TaxID=441103 RepID=A0A0P1G0A5_9RHOB|nr:DUF6173 family protein [Tropicibacter naphthalenivorans]CUH75085.1 hypothetical protein TRN7648_00251 [Tropicibacter naphthalenivorans]SMC46821.1 hypothetical protein SAMN04488093_101629 [Tropicibacter naphthalenivorans]